MDRKSLVLAAMSPAKCDTYTPIQVQKLLFLIDSNVPKSVGGPHFNFEPYDYGPFDSSVYWVLEELENDGLINVVEVPGRNWKRYCLTEKGQQQGEMHLNYIGDESAREYIASVSEFVRRLSFSKLVSAIYKAYPEMKMNSVFNG